jgi:glutamyl-tRNA synthetase
VVVTRFAPSPTGYLHVGGARTALYSYLYARRQGGRFILRIEDTDQERSDPKMVEGILDGLRWLGVQWDDGPFFQSERKPAYDGLFEKLLATGHAYECFCTSVELEARRKEAAGTPGVDAFRYDGRCRSLSDAERASRRAAGERPALRLRLPENARTVVVDALRGEVVFEASVLDDLVIRKSDGFPTFHFAVAVDDALMGVTHVVRGDDHLSNTPKQIQILRALRASTGDDLFREPVYAHLPLILGPDGKRFSKRHGATSVGEYRARGFLPGALINYLALLGWSPGEDRELMTLSEMEELFDLDRVNLRGAIFDEVKLTWMNGRYITALDTGALEGMLVEYLAPFAITDEALARWGVSLSRTEWLAMVLGFGRDRATLLPEIIELTRFFLTDEITIDADAAAKNFKGDDWRARLTVGGEAVRAAEPWSLESIEREIRGRAEAAGFKPPKVMHPLRVAVTGRGQSPGLFETIFCVGRARALDRIEKALASAG